MKAIHQRQFLHYLFVIIIMRIRQKTHQCTRHSCGKKMNHFKDFWHEQKKTHAGRNYCSNPAGIHPRRRATTHLGHSMRKALL